MIQKARYIIMSSFMMRAESIATIADFISSVIRLEWNYVHMAFDGDEVWKILYDVCKHDANYNNRISEVTNIKAVYNALSEMNHNAVNQRYEGINFEAEPFPKEYKQFEVAGNYKDGAFEIPISYYQLLKSIDCYLYQCSEGNVPESALYKAVEDIRAMLANWIIRNTIAYNAANWG